MRRNLVFARVGPGSLHNSWIKNEPDRNWDICVNWHTQQPDHDSAEYINSFGINKYLGFLEFFDNEFPADFNYEYILLLDDDISFPPNGITDFFDICRKHSLYISQPSIKIGSNINFSVTGTNPFCLFRRTRFVEVMMPCFSKEALLLLKHTFAKTKSTWGLDYIWASALRDQSAFAIVDAVSVEHVRKPSVQGGEFYRMLRTMGIDAQEEFKTIKEDHQSFGGYENKRSGHLLRWKSLSFLSSPIVMITESIKRKIIRSGRK